MASMAQQEVNLADSVVTSANGPRAVSVAGMGSSEEHSLPDQIAAAKFRPLNATRKRVGAGIRFGKFIAGGAV